MKPGPDADPADPLPGRRGNGVDPAEDLPGRRGERARDPIPDDGPVGRLLQDTGRHPWRAAHIHLKATADGFTPLTTHIFDRASDYLDSDTVFGVKESLIEDFVPSPGGVLVCEHDVVLTRG